MLYPCTQMPITFPISEDIIYEVKKSLDGSNIKNWPGDIEIMKADYEHTIQEQSFEIMQLREKIEELKAGLDKT